MNATEIMTSDVITVRATATLREAAQTLRDHKISGAPVVDDRGVMVGVISEKDLLMQAQSHAAVPRLAFFGADPIPEAALQEAYRQGMTTPVSAAMTYPVVSAREDDSVVQLADLMTMHHVNRVPILRDGVPVGIVTREDVLEVVVQMLSAQDDNRIGNGVAREEQPVRDAV